MKNLDYGNAMFGLADEIEINYGTAILEELTGESLIRKGQPVRLFDQSTKTAEAYYPADERGKPYIQNFQEGRRWYPITAYCEAYQVDWKTAIQQFERKFLDGSPYNGHGPEQRVHTSVLPAVKPPASFHDPVFVKRTLSDYQRNNFAFFLRRLSGEPVANELLARFRVGTWPGGVAREWQRCTIYWQIDQTGNIHAGKVMYYHAGSGRRIKQECPDFAMPAWAHKLIGLTDFHLDQCLFGLHQLNGQLADKPIALVESEKSAIICTAFEPDFIWLATGGLGQMSMDKFKPLKGRQIVLFPDLGGFKKWNDKAEELKKLGYAVSVSSILEGHSSVLERHAGYDLADFLTRYRCADTGRVLNEPDGYPALWDCKPLNPEPTIRIISPNDYMNQSGRLATDWQL